MWTDRLAEQERDGDIKQMTEGGGIVRERDGVRRVFVLDVWDVLYSLARSSVPDWAAPL